MSGAETANPISLAVAARPKGVRPMPSSSDIGAMKKPKLPTPMPMLSPPTTLSAATTAQP